MDSQAWRHAYIDHDGVLRDASNPQRVNYGHPNPDDFPQVLHVSDIGSAVGRRLIVMRPDGPLTDIRAASDVFTDSEGTWIRIVDEPRWHAWTTTPHPDTAEFCPRSVAVPILNVWVLPQP